MPSVTQYRERTVNYRTRPEDMQRYRNLYANTSAAYDVGYAYPKKAAQPKPVIKTEAKPKSKNALMLNICFMVFVALCFSVVCRYVMIFEDNQKITGLEKQYEQVLSLNQSLQTKIDKGIEMGELENYARTELGMMKPESHQIFYIDIKMDDYSSTNADKKQANAISGTPGALVNAFSVLK